MNAVQAPRPLFDSRWMAHAACTRMSGLPKTENRAPRLLVDLTAETCAACPVQEVCAAFVHQTRVVAGWRAGWLRSVDSQANDDVAAQSTSDAA